MLLPEITHLPYPEQGMAITFYVTFGTASLLTLYFLCFGKR